MAVELLKLCIQDIIAGPRPIIVFTLSTHDTTVIIGFDTHDPGRTYQIPRPLSTPQDLF